MSDATGRVAILVPMPDRRELTASEQLSLRHLRHYLGGYDTYFLAPEGTPTAVAGIPVRRFAPEYFGSAAAHSRLMLSSRLYRAFDQYEFVLLHHLDALVFSDQMERWCAAGFDYIGAPWLLSADQPERGFAGVGNGGLSLRRVSAFLRVLRSRRYKLHPSEFWRRHHSMKPFARRLVNRPRQLLQYLGVHNNVRSEVARFKGNEDRFWSKRATHYDPEFRIAPVDLALRFAFERAPRHCFEANGRVLPFGCHAWERYDREFWEPHLLTSHATTALRRGSNLGH